ncbi:MAG TPA: hypothetical protein P5567_07605 [Kiritimatiellia bacterium]|nr:hypothetical protein [Kiritimatiellia bacterium]HRZ12304.1 hypothetical protein [Kiritimatiellia bacterium]HSA17938.1 hypothetical protein [Kiritimatiellia bacterium]
MLANDIRLRWAILLAVGILCGAAGLLTRTSLKDTGCVPSREKVVSSNTRHDRLDFNVVKGLKVSDADKGWGIRVGSVDIRRKPIGFIRLGAFNEARITDLRVTMSAQQDPSSFATLLHRLSSSPDTLETVLRRGERDRARLAYLLDQFGTRSPYRNTRISSVHIEGLSLQVSPSNAESDIMLLEADSVDFHGRRCRLNGAVSFGSLDGQRVRCREAELTLGTDPVISTHPAILQAAGATQEVETLSFPLAALLTGEDLRPYMNQSPTRTR